MIIFLSAITLFSFLTFVVSVVDIYITVKTLKSLIARIDVVLIGTPSNAGYSQFQTHTTEKNSEPKEQKLKPRSFSEYRAAVEGGIEGKW